MILNYEPKITQSISGASIVTNHERIKAIPFNTYEDAALYLSEVQKYVSQRNGQDLPFVFVPEDQGDHYTLTVRKVINGKVAGKEVGARYETLESALEAGRRAHNDWFVNPKKYDISLESISGSQFTLSKGGVDYKLQVFLNKLPVPSNYAEDEDETEICVCWNLRDGKKLAGYGSIAKDGMIRQSNINNEYQRRGLYTSVLSVVSNFTSTMSGSYYEGTLSLDAKSVYEKLAEAGFTREQWRDGGYYVLKQGVLQDKALEVLPNIFKDPEAKVEVSLDSKAEPKTFRPKV